MEEVDGLLVVSEFLRSANASKACAIDPLDLRVDVLLGLDEPVLLEAVSAAPLLLLRSELPDPIESSRDSDVFVPGAIWLAAVSLVPELCLLMKMSFRIFATRCATPYLRR